MDKQPTPNQEAPMEMTRVPRDTNGKLPAYAWPGGYPIYYLVADMGTLCPPCANGENGSVTCWGCNTYSGQRVATTNTARKADKARDLHATSSAHQQYAAPGSLISIDAPKEG